MIDRDLIDLLEPNTRVSVRTALMALARSGILLAQQDRLLTQLASGNDGEDEATLAKRILTYRVNKNRLAGLQHLGESLLDEEKRHAS